MIKNGICFGGMLAKKIPFSSTNVPPKNAPVPPTSRVGPACTLRKIQTYELITREFLGLRMRKFQGVIFKLIKTWNFLNLH